MSQATTHQHFWSMRRSRSQADRGQKTRVERPERESTGAGASRFAHYIKRPFERLTPYLFAIAIGIALATGYLNRGEQLMTPEEGTGYWLGVTGATMMLLVFLYPLRKRLKILRMAGSVKGWFRVHMLLGVIGPTLILFHANFKLSSANATMAMFAMMTVVASGLVGRYLYSRIHMGLYGRQAEAGEILQDIAALEASLGQVAGEEPVFVAELRTLEACLPAQDAGVFASFRAMMRLRSHSKTAVRLLARRMEALIREQARIGAWSRSRRKSAIREARIQLWLFRAALKKAGALAFYTRLFALWHVLHLPLFILLIVTAVVHIIAVHLY